MPEHRLPRFPHGVVCAPGSARPAFLHTHEVVCAPGSARRASLHTHDVGPFRVPSWTGMLEPGTALPYFECVSDQGATVRSTDFAGRWTILWWYVRADTPG